MGKEKCRPILTGKTVCATPELFAEGNLGRGPFQEGFSETVQGVFNLMDTDPSPIELKNIMATAIDALVDSGDWDEIEQLMAVLDTSANSLIDWIGTQNFLAVASPTFDPYDFWEFNGTTQYLNSQLSPSTNSKALQDSAEYGAFNVSHDGPSGNEFLIGENTAGTRRTTIFSDAVGGDLNCHVHQATNLTDASESSFAANSMYAARRPDSANVELWKNGVQVDTQAIGSTVKGTNSIYIGARDNAGVADLFYGGKVALYYTGSGSINTLNIYNVLSTMITDIAALG